MSALDATPVPFSDQFGIKAALSPGIPSKPFNPRRSATDFDSPDTPKYLQQTSTNDGLIPEIVFPLSLKCCRSHYVPPCPHRSTDGPAEQQSNRRWEKTKHWVASRIFRALELLPKTGLKRTDLTIHINIQGLVTDVIENFDTCTHKILRCTDVTVEQVLNA